MALSGLRTLVAVRLFSVSVIGTMSGGNERRTLSRSATWGMGDPIEEIIHATRAGITLLQKKMELKRRERKLKNSRRWAKFLHEK